jgi:hypothetical protein
MVSGTCGAGFELTTMLSSEMRIAIKEETNKRRFIMPAKCLGKNKHILPIR